MTAQFKPFKGDWVTLRSLKPREVDLHFGRRDDGKSYEESMAGVESLVRAELQRARDDGAQHVLFVHGCSTSLGWQKTTARSVVREFMRSAAATPFIVRNECLQGDTVFLARIRLTATT